MTFSLPDTARVRGGRADVVMASVVETRRVGGAPTTRRLLLAAVAVVKKFPVCVEWPGWLDVRLPMPVRGRSRLSASLPQVAATAIRARGPCTRIPHWIFAGAVISNALPYRHSPSPHEAMPRYHVHSISSSLPAALLL